MNFVGVEYSLYIDNRIVYVPEYIDKLWKYVVLIGIFNLYYIPTSYQLLPGSLFLHGYDCSLF